MATAGSSPARWGLTLSIALIAAALAYYYQAQQPLFPSFLSSSPSSPAAAAEKKYCYSGVRTQDSGNPVAQCFSVVDGTFSAVWSEAGASEATTEHEHERIDGYVIPGLWDGHGHLLQYGEFLHAVDLFGAETIDEVRTRVKAYVATHPGAGSRGNWVRGVGWDQTFYGRMPTADDFDQDPELSGLYLMLDRIDVHCNWVSNPVLDLLPASSLPASVPGGEIVRDPGLGVFCDNAMDLVLNHWPKPSPEAQAVTVRDAIRSLNAQGIVGMHDAGATPGTLSLYANMAQDAASWTLRVYSMLECDQRNTFCPDAAATVGERTSKAHPERLAVRSVKIFGDGALGSWGSAMLEPYSDRPDTAGSMLINASALTAVTKNWAAAGYQVNIHAIGDLANRNAINAFEAALDQECPGSSSSEPDSERTARLAACQAQRRFRIEHAQIIHPDDQARILALGILPSVQPTHATSDMKYALARLGQQRLAGSAYRMRSLLPARPVLGSDFPVEPPNPFHGLYAAIARRSPATGHGADPDKPDAGWHTGEALSLDDALWGFTGGPAYGAFLDGRAGVIRKGALADWVVLDRPLEALDVEDLRTLTVRETWVAGRKVYSRP